MSEIAGMRPVERPVAAPSPVEAVPTTPNPRRAADGAPDGSRLDPAVTLDIGRDERAGAVERDTQGAYRGRYVKDAESRQVVFQVIDPGTGTIMVQLPSPQAIEARTYAEAAAAARSAAAAERDRALDRTA
ncbi:hypothetical protein [Methylobacterium planeticum]|uniref:Flagellar protein FlaG n=1 Tax=Methylobacterium planeticum TaxID=2615211 RepID=A0A6N6MXC0_9HYPH|nr:hypothetical protein [Methylobacterium planeticum]KAB1076079.1 hypothetical protein F6X51_00620 [Methylobacterium planeticum]